MLSFEWMASLRRGSIITSWCTARKHAHTHAHIHAWTHAQPLERTAIAVVDWPSGVPGFFEVGLSTISRWTPFVILYFSFLPRFALVTMITLLAQGKRHASALPAVLSCRHSREVTIGPVACLSEKYLAQWPSERLQRCRSPTHTCYLTDPHPAISFTKTGPVAILDSCLSNWLKAKK